MKLKLHLFLDDDKQLVVDLVEIKDFNTFRKLIPIGLNMLESAVQEQEDAGK